VNSRVLVIDDEENVRDGIRAMLTPRVRDTSEIDALGMRLFGGGGVEKPPPPPLPFRFEVDVAPTGQEGLWRVADALAEGRPYAALFVDMRMPGWDGLETVRRIREIDDQAEVVFVTAYSDYAVREIVARAGMNVSYHCKPFSSEEIQQLAIKAVYEWNKARQVEEMVSAVGRLAEMDASPDAMRREVLAFAGGHLGAEAGILAERAADGSWQSAAERGDVGDAFRQAALACAGTFAAEGARRFACCRDGCICLRFGKAAAVALAVDATQPGPTSERFYPVRLYLEHAWHVWENARLRAELAHKEKLSAIGAAIGMVAHDLRGPLCTIQGTGDCLLDGYAEGEAEKEEMLRGIRNTAKSCLGYVEDVLDFVRGAPPRIVFVTSHREHALEAFGLNALHYLVKPVALGMLKEALARLPAQNDPQDAPVLLKEASRQCVVKLRDVLAVRSSGDYTDVYLGAANVWCVHKTLKQWRDELPAGAFVALGRFLIVNRNEIQGLSKDATGEGATLQIGNSLHLELSKSAAKAAAAILRERANP
jgi:two-component system, NtrC family, sensor kinase